MKIISTIEEMQSWSIGQKKLGQKIAFVPTMGALHEGHLSLLGEGKKLGDKLVLSIYVNPTQFGPTEDLAKYPRDLDGDLEKAKSCGVDVVFFPSDTVMYPDGYKTYVEVRDLSKKLCGASRPTHFDGVTTVVAKLFNIVMPDVAVFGEKDFQQLTIIKRMTCDLNLPIEIVGHPIVREKDGLAKSSRNVYLSKDERNAALSLSRSLVLANELIEKGETSAEKILSKMRKEIESTGLIRIDYLKLVDTETLNDLSKFKRPAVIAIAAFAGKTRLIDNRLFL